MLGFKANKIEVFEEDILPLSISWLILTDNKIKVLPKSLGKLHRLQKCALAGNQIKTIPEEIAGCQNLELLRLSANNIEALPKTLGQKFSKSIIQKYSYNTPSLPHCHTVSFAPL